MDGRLLMQVHVFSRDNLFVVAVLFLDIERDVLLGAVGLDARYSLYVRSEMMMGVDFSEVFI
jgi:hypothetical protein